MKPVIALLALSLSSVLSPVDDVEVPEHILAIFQALPKSAKNPENPLSEAKIELGRQLFFDPRLSLDQKVSCNTCHDLASYGDDGLPTSLGIDGQKGARNAPTVFNAALHLSQFWDGRAKDLEEQATAPILNPVEMGMPSPSHVLAVLNSIPPYRHSFAQAFPESPKPEITFKKVGHAIAAFERQLLTPSRFDRFLKGNSGALSAQEKRGLNTFVIKGCASCHSGVGVGGHMYQKLGVFKPWPTPDKGRANVPGQEQLTGYFKVPSLRNSTETAPYLHDGSIAHLDEVIRKMAIHQSGQRLRPGDVDDIIAFLGSLRGELDPKLTQKPKLPASTKATPKARSTSRSQNSPEQSESK
ncbi:MAG: cytochrome-c peroxidase [Verrucomicrobiales bacterium]